LQGDEDHGRHQVGAVVHGDVGLVVEGGDDVLVVGVVVLLADGEDGDAEVLDEAGGDVVLGAERVGGDEDEVGAAGLDGAGQVGGLGGGGAGGGEGASPPRRGPVATRAGAG